MQDKPLTLIDELEESQRGLTEAIIEEYHKMKEAIGPRPLWGKRRSPTERLAYYDQVKNDPEEWGRIIEKDGPGEALKFAVEMERLRSKQVPVEEPLIAV